MRSLLPTVVSFYKRRNSGVITNYSSDSSTDDVVSLAVVQKGGATNCTRKRRWKRNNTKRLIHDGLSFHVFRTFVRLFVLGTREVLPSSWTVRVGSS